METLVIVAQFYVGSDIRHGHFPRGVDHTMDALVLQSAEKGLGHRIIVTTPGPPDRLSDAERPKRACKPRRSVIAAAIGVENCAAFDIVIPDGHPDRFLDEFGLVIVVHGPPDHGFGVTIDDRGEVDPALPGGNVGDIADHFLAGRGRGEVPADEVGQQGGRGFGEAQPPRPRLTRLQAQLTHDAADQFQCAALALTFQLRVDAAVPVGLVRVREDLLDQLAEIGAPPRGRRFRA